MTSTKMIVLPEVLDISRVSEYHSKLVDEVGNGDVLTFDAKSIERVDAAFLQLLTAFCLNAPSRGITVEWSAPSEVFLSGVEPLGLSSYLGFSTNS